MKQNESCQQPPNIEAMIIMSAIGFSVVMMQYMWHKSYKIRQATVQQKKEASLIMANGNKLEESGVKDVEDIFARLQNNMTSWNRAQMALMLGTIIFIVLPSLVTLIYQIYLLNTNKNYEWCKPSHFSATSLLCLGSVFYAMLMAYVAFIDGMFSYTFTWSLTCSYETLQKCISSQQRTNWINRFYEQDFGLAIMVFSAGVFGIMCTFVLCNGWMTMYDDLYGTKTWIIKICNNITTRPIMIS